MKRSKRILAVFLAITLMVLPLMSQRGAYEVYAESADDSTATNDKAGNGLKDSQDQSLQDGSSQNTETNAETEVSKESGEESKEGLDKQNETEEKEPTSTEPQVEKQEKTVEKATLEAAPKAVTNKDLNISKVKVVGDASDLSVPNSVSVELTVTGGAKDSLESVHLYYYCSETGKSFNTSAYDFQWDYRQGTDYSTYTIRNIELNQYFAKGNYKLELIEMNAASYNINVNYSYDSETKNSHVLKVGIASIILVRQILL